SRSCNEKMLTWHLSEAVLGWTSVLVGAILIYFFHVPILDPLLSIGYTLFILWGVTRRLRDVANLLLQGVPGHIDLEKMKRDILEVEGVQGLHDVHVWSLDGQKHIFSAHIVLETGVTSDAKIVKANVNAVLRKHHIDHATLELEAAGECSGEPGY